MISFPIAALTSLQKDILRTILYFDIFHHPLTAQEIYRYLPSDSATQDEIGAACQQPPLSSVIQLHNDFYSLSFNGEAVRMSKERQEKAKRARRYLPVARLMARIIRTFPFVRGICLSGELSKGVASRHGDIDYLIITANDRLWIARTLLIAFKKLFLFNRKRFFCLNHFVTERAYEVRDRSLYTALEIASLVPLTDYSRYLAYQDANSWIGAYLPNFEVETDPLVVRTGAGLVQRFLEFFLKGKPGDRLDEMLRRYWEKVWEKRYPMFSEDERKCLFRCERDLSTSYVGDFMPKIMAAYRSKLEEFHLLPIKGL